MIGFGFTLEGMFLTLGVCRPSRVRGLGFRAWGLGFRVQRFRVQEFRVWQGLAGVFGFEGFGFRVWGV